MTPVTRGPRVKFERAQAHLGTLETELKAFFRTNPYVIGTKRNPSTRQLIYYLIHVADVPETVPAIVGDALQCLRSALDHLAHQLVVSGTGSAGPFSHVYFPIADTEPKYNEKRSGQLKGATSGAIAAVDAVKPYRGGNDALWLLHTMNNIDKHRLLIGVGSAARSLDLGAHMHRLMQKSFASSPHFQGHEMPKLEFFVRPADRMCPFRAGDELFIDQADAEPIEDMQFRFDVSFNEPGVTDEPVMELLVRIATEVESVMGRLEILV